jgi:hypothetical protein
MYQRILGEVATQVQDGSLSWLLEASQYRTPLEASLLLMAGMHRQVLVKADGTEKLRQYYPSVGGSLQYSDPDFIPLFLEAMEICKEKLATIIRDETVQTNETQRGLFWLAPTIAAGLKHIHLVDLGASAGLNLVADQRRYTWTDGEASESFGLAPSNQFICRVAPRLPNFLERDHPVPMIVSRTGCDLNPFRLETYEDRAKLESFIWPDQIQRLARLDEGIAAHRSVSLHQQISIHKANLPHDLPRFLNLLHFQDEYPVVIYNTYMTTYLDDHGRAMRDYIDRWSKQQKRAVFWIQSEPEEGAPVKHHWCAWTVDLWEGDEKHHWRLAWVHPHGTEIDFLEDLEEFEHYCRKLYS